MWKIIYLWMRNSNGRFFDKKVNVIFGQHILMTSRIDRNELIKLIKLFHPYVKVH